MAKNQISIDQKPGRDAIATVTIGGRAPAPVAADDAAPCKVLFLAANPAETTPLALDRECAAIQDELDRAAGCFVFQTRFAVTIESFMRHLDDLKPHVIHFSGHGQGLEGLTLQDAQGQPKVISSRALALMIASTSPPRLVVLNACFTDVQADELRNVVECVVGMAGAVDDPAARIFAASFYRALGGQRSVGNALAQAVATLAAHGLLDERLPVCRTRDGVDPHGVVLA